MRHSYLLSTFLVKFGFGLVFAGTILGIVNALFSGYVQLDLSLVQRHLAWAVGAGCVAILGVFAVGPLVVRWILRRRITVLVALLALSAIDYRVAAASAIATILVMLFARFWYGPAAGVRAFFSLSHIPVGIRAINTFGFLYVMFALVNMQYIKADLVMDYFNYMESLGGWSSTAFIGSLLLMVYVCYHCGNRFFPIVFSSLPAIAVFHLGLVIVNPFAGYLALLVVAIGGLVNGLLSLNYSNVGVNNSSTTPFRFTQDCSRIGDVGGDLDRFYKDYHDGISACGITRD